MTTPPPDVAEAAYMQALADYNAGNITYIDLAYANDTVLVARGTPEAELDLRAYRKRRLSDWPILFEPRTDSDCPPNPFIPRALQMRRGEWQAYWQMIDNQWWIVFPWTPGGVGQLRRQGEEYPDGSGDVITAKNPDQLRAEWEAAQAAAQPSEEP